MNDILNGTTKWSICTRKWSTASGSDGRVRLGIEGLLVGDSPPTDSLCKCVQEQDTLSAA